MATPTINEFLADNGLAEYTAAFTQHGWDHVPTLQRLVESDLKQLISDVAMVNGHAVRFRAALGLLQSSHAANSPTANGAATEPTAAAAPAAAPDMAPAPAPPTVPPSNDDCQTEFYNKLMSQNTIGLIHGTTIETYKSPTETVPVIRVMNKKEFYCICW